MLGFKLKRILFVFISLLSCNSIAKPNTMQFLGATSNQTCIIEVNGSSSNPVVLLETVTVNDLVLPASYAGEKWFELSLRDCIPLQADDVYLTKLVGNATSEGNLINAAGDAENVALQLLNSNKEPIELYQPAVLEIDMPTGANKGKLRLGVRYLSEEGNATAGSVISNLQYLVTYN